MDDKADKKRARLAEIDSELREARETYRRRRRDLREKRRAVLHDWSEEKERERAQYLTARRERNAERRKRRRLLSEPPVRTVLEEVGSSVTHGAGAALSIVALILLLLKADRPAAVFSGIVYGGCLFLMFLMSCLYHAFRTGSTVKRIWRRFDYCSIYLLIGGTITPIHLLFIGGNGPVHRHVGSDRRRRNLCGSFRPDVRAGSAFCAVLRHRMERGSFHTAYVVCQSGTAVVHPFRGHCLHARDDPLCVEGKGISLYLAHLCARRRTAPVAGHLDVRILSRVPVQTAVPS